MVARVSELMSVDAELNVPTATAQLVRFHLPDPIDNVMNEDSESYRLDLCLTPRPDNARGCFLNRWNHQRFERLGQVFLVPPGETLRARSDGRCEQTSLLCRLHSDSIQAWFDGELQWTSQRLVAGLDIRDATIRQLLMRLVAEARQPGFASDMLVELIVAQLSIELSRYCFNNDFEKVSGGLAPWRLKLIDERLGELLPVPTLDELARLCDISVRQLTRGFRISRGCTIGDHVANSRIEHAKRMLATEASVKSIAYSLGFSSPSSFCYAFRRAVGDSPGQFRQRLRHLH